MQDFADSELMTLAAVIDPDGHRLLLLWSESMRRWRPNVGYPRRSVGLGTGGGSGAEAFEHLCEETDTRVARAVETIVDDLALGYRSVLQHAYLASVYRWRGSPAEALPDALAAFSARARGKGLL